jgi:hypothetical protein
MVFGSVNQFVDKSAVFRATSALRRDINMAKAGAEETISTLKSASRQFSGINRPSPLVLCRS